MQPIHSTSFSTPVATLKKFRCPIWHPSFKDVRLAEKSILVFPLEAVSIHQLGREPVVANPNVVMLYNAGQEYQRFSISEHGDHSDYFVFSPEAIDSSVGRFSRADNNAAFPVPQIKISHGLFLRQRRLLRRLQRGEFASCPGEWNEESLSILDLVIDELFEFVQNRKRPKQIKPQTHRRRTTLVNETQALLSTRYSQNLNLDQLAGSLDSSPFHLCRIFRELCGTTIHQYLNSIRLRRAIDFLNEGREDLTRLALDLGFSSHSHFSSSFRRAFGITPTDWRGMGNHQPFGFA